MRIKVTLAFLATLEPTNDAFIGATTSINNVIANRTGPRAGQLESFILRQNANNLPEVTGDENSYAEIDDSCTIPEVLINKGYLTKITAERARRERPDFIAPGTTNEVQKALVGKPLEKVVRSAPVMQEKERAPQSTKVIKLDGGRISIVDAIQPFGWTPKTRFACQ